MTSPLMLPAFVQSENDLLRIVKLGETPESHVLEFKADLNAWRSKDSSERRKARKETCRDISAFANHIGGCLLFGVTETRSGELKVADAFVGLDDVDGRVQWITQAVRSYLVPSTLTIDVVPVAIGKQRLLALNIPASRDCVALWDSDEHTVEYLRRTPHGKEWMNPDEAIRHTLDASRTKKTAFLRAKERLGDTSNVQVALVGGVDRLVEERGANTPYSFARVHSATIYLGRVGDEDFELRVTIPSGSPAGPESVLIPYGSIRQVWTTVDSKLGLDLDLRLTCFGSKSSITLDRAR
jgi:hypothetical protein